MKTTYLLKGLRQHCEDETPLPFLVATKLKTLETNIQHLRILRRSIDARQKQKAVYWIYDVQFKLLKKPPFLPKNVTIFQPPQPVSIPTTTKDRPIIVGFGPAALFAALVLVESNNPPLILERGKPVEKRRLDVNEFWHSGVLNPESNIQFGEGGAGTFSDGKLTARNATATWSNYFFEKWRQFGIPENVFMDKRPHLGTDRLQQVLPKMRMYLQEHGAEIRFEHRVDDLIIENNQIVGIQTQEQFFPTRTVFWATGNAAFDSIEMLIQRGIQMEAKGFAVGARLELPQATINRIQLGKFAFLPQLPPSEFFVTYKDASGCGVYSFCMCPGGQVINATSHQGRMTVNGMSYAKRQGQYGNAAIVVNVAADEFPDVQAIMNWQKQIEERAFVAGGSNFSAPAQNAMDFLQKKISTELQTNTFLPKLTSVPLDDIFPPTIHEPLRNGLKHFHHQMPKLLEEAILIAPETRTSAPFRITRCPQHYHSISCENLFPIGEGSGYAGGIYSSAIDGAQAALAWLHKK